MNQPPLLLIVDDSKVSRMMIRKMILEVRPDWRIIEASSGDESLITVKEQKPDLVSMDLNMPGITGLEAAQHIRTNYPDIRIVMCSANVQETIREAALRVGLYFVSKPLSPASVNEAVAFFEAT